MPLFLKLPITVRKTAVTALISATFLTIVGPTHAQTEYRTSFDLTSPNYEDRDADSRRLYGFVEFGGASLVSSGEVTYSFGEGNGTSLGAESDTIRFAGTGRSSANGFGFTDLKASVTSTLQNAYLDLRDIENAPVVGDGMKAPYQWSASALAGWTLTSRFQSTQSVNNNYLVKWIFIVDGVENTSDSRLGTANLSFQYGGSLPEFFTTSSLIPQVWATNSTPVQWGQGLQTRADFVANWNYSLDSEGTAVFGESQEGEDPELIGYLATSPVLDATVDYGSTVKLDEIQVFDPSGNRFYDFTVDDGNGNQYYNGLADAGAVAAPEPGTFALVGLGTLMLLPVARRRRQARLSAR